MYGSVRKYIDLETTNYDVSYPSALNSVLCILDIVSANQGKTLKNFVFAYASLMLLSYGAKT